MANKRNNDSRTDVLLKQVLKDDLPPEVEGRMKAHFIRFRERVEQDEWASELTSIGNWKRFFQLKWAVSRKALAFSSLIMIVFGAFLHVSGHRSAVAETLFFLNTSVSVADQVQEATSMECRMQVLTVNGQYRLYVIRWLSPEMTRVDVQEGKTLSKSLFISVSDITVVDHINNALQRCQYLEHIKDPVFNPALEFLSPLALATAIYEKWKPQHYREEDKGKKGTYFYINNGERITLEMTVDMNTSLPVIIRKFSSDRPDTDDACALVMEAQFIWNEPISPQIKKEDYENDFRK